MQLAVFVAVVAARFLVPLLIPRYPLPAIVAALVLDGVDQSIFQAFGYDPPGYQGYDKAMDVYYLAVAYLSVLRNWTSGPAAAVARFLFFYRLAGVVAFQLLHLRVLLLVFPNTFEYFFIAYEIVRLRWDPARYGIRFWTGVAAAIWIVVKLPQEYWIHVAQLDFTDTLAELPWLGPLLTLGAAALAWAAWRHLRPRLPRPDWPVRWAAEPLPAARVAAPGRLRSAATAEKAALVSLVVVCFAQVLPGIRSTDAELVLGTTVFVLANTAVSGWAARSARTARSALGAFAVRVLLNAGLVLLAEVALGRERGDVNLGNALFFVLLLSLLTLLDDRCRAARQVRTAAAVG